MRGRGHRRAAPVVEMALGVGGKQPDQRSEGAKKGDLWMCRILHHFDSMVATITYLQGNRILSGFLGGAGFRPPTVPIEIWSSLQNQGKSQNRPKELLPMITIPLKQLQVAKRQNTFWEFASQSWALEVYLPLVKSG